MHVQVKFDDGDSGKIPVEHIRLLPQSWPESKSKPNPLHVLRNRTRRRMSSSEALQEAIRASLSPSMQVNGRIKRTTKNITEDNSTIKSDEDEKNDINFRSSTKLGSKANKKDNSQTIKENNKDSNANHLPRDLNEPNINKEEINHQTRVKDNGNSEKDIKKGSSKTDVATTSHETKNDCGNARVNTDSVKNMKNIQTMVDNTAETSTVEQSYVDETESSKDEEDGLIKRKRLPSGGFNSRKCK